MPGTILPQKRVLGEASSARRNIPAAPSSSKKRRLEPPSSPAIGLNSSQNRLASSQPKSAFESEFLEKLSQEISDRKQNNSEKDQAWARPPIAADFSPKTTSLRFQSIEAEEGTLHGGQTTVKLFGVNEDGNSVMLHVKDFKHYLYLPAPVSFTPQDCTAFKQYLETRVAQHQPVIDSVQFTMRESIYGFQNNTQNPFLKITVADPKFINRVRSTIEDNNANWKGMWRSEDGKLMTYDNLQYVLRFMVDCGVSVPMCFLESAYANWHRSGACAGSRPPLTGINL